MASGIPPPSPTQPASVARSLLFRSYDGGTGQLVPGAPPGRDLLRGEAWGWGSLFCCFLALCQDRLLREGFKSTAALRWLVASGDGPRLLALVLDAPSPLQLPGIVPEWPLHVSICFEAPAAPSTP